MADRNYSVGGDANFRLLYKDVSGGTADLYAPAVTIVGTNGAVLQPTAGGGLGASTNGVLSSYSTSDTPLAGNATFTPSGGSFNGFDDLAAMGWPSALEVTVVTDVAGQSSTGPAIQVQWSRDGTTVELADGALVTVDTPFGGIAGDLGVAGGLTIPTGLRKTFTFPVREYQYCRVAYQNGSTIQTVFHYRAVYRYNPTERGCNYRYSPGHGSWEAVPTNTVLTMISAATRAGNVTATTGTRTNLMHIGGIFTLVVTTVPASPVGLDVSMDVSVNNGSTFTRVNAAMTGFYITTTGSFNFIWHPSANNLSSGISASTAKVMLGFPFPLTYRVQVIPQDASGAVNYAYSMNATLITQ